VFTRHESDHGWGCVVLTARSTPTMSVRLPFGVFNEPYRAQLESCLHRSAERRRAEQRELSHETVQVARIPRRIRKSVRCSVS